jgi:hypothetical protein
MGLPSDYTLAGQARSYTKLNKFKTLAKARPSVTIAAAICANNKSKQQRPNL